MKIKQTLDEVVVTGYGAQKKVAVTGAISAVSIKDLKKASGALQKSDTLKRRCYLPKRPIVYRVLVVPEPVTGMKQYKKVSEKEYWHTLRTMLAQKSKAKLP